MSAPRLYGTPPSVFVDERPAPDASNCLRCGKTASLVLTVQDWALDTCLVLITCPGHYLLTLDAAEREASRVYGTIARRPAAEVAAEFDRVAGELYARHPELNRPHR